MEFCRPEYWSGYPFPSLGDFPNPGIEPRSPALQLDSLPAEPQGKPKNTGVGSFSLLQRIFLTQELNQGLLHCRRILYQLSYQRSPNSLNWALKGNGLKKNVGKSIVVEMTSGPKCKYEGSKINEGKWLILREVLH